MREVGGRGGEGRGGGYHEERRNDPVHEHAEGDLYPYRALAEDVVERFEFDLAHDGVHHHQEPHRYSTHQPPFTPSLNFTPLSSPKFHSGKGWTYQSEH